MGFLSEKVADVRKQLERKPLDDSANLARALAMPRPRDFVGAVRAARPAVIAEVKRASPSAGEIADRDLMAQARAYASGGAAAASGLTGERDFGAAPSGLRAG